MGEIVEFPKPKVPHMMLKCGDTVMTIMVSDIQGIADGRLAISEFEDPENVARILATMLMSLIDGAD